MKVVLAFDLGEDFVGDLRATFPQIEFAPAYTVEEQLREVPDAEVQFGLITRDVFLKAKQLRWIHFIGAGFDYAVRDNPELVDRGMHLTPETPTYSMRGCGGLPADAGGV